MFVPFTIRDFIDRAETVYGGLIGVVDEPDQPDADAPPLDPESERLAESGAAP